MELGWMLPVGVLALAVLAILLERRSLRCALRETAEQLAEKLETDTNTPVCLSSGDRAVRALAAQINTQLRVLRREHLRLRNGDAALKAAVTNVSHDLRTPLTAICGYLDLLEETPQSEQARRYLGVIRERTEAMRRMTDELLRYSVAAAGEAALHPEPARLNDVLEQSLAGFYGALMARGITPRVTMPEEPVLRTLDRAALRRVLDNVLGNAVKYSDGDLAVALTPDGTLCCENAAERLGRVRAERLFDRYFTVESADGATGLGLSIARLLTERMGGHIRADYREGRLCVRVSFPP